MVIPFKIRVNKGSFIMTLPKSVGLHLELDKEFKEKKFVVLIAEIVEGGVLLRYPVEDEIERFEL